MPFPDFLEKSLTLWDSADDLKNTCLLKLHLCLNHIIQPRKVCVTATLCCILAVSCDCQREHTEWDKLFIMLENSQMKENMLLHSLDEILKVELQRLRGEMHQVVENFASHCLTSTEQATSRISNQLDQILDRKNQEARDRSVMLCESGQGKVLQEILQLSRNLSNRLSHLEHAWQRREELDVQQRSLPEKDYMTRGDSFILNSLWQELQETKAELKESHKKKTQNLLPFGK